MAARTMGPSWALPGGLPSSTEISVASIREPESRVPLPEDPGDRSLRSSIRASGIMEPLLVRPVAGGYEVQDGVRRLRAARRLGLATVPATIQRPALDEPAGIPGSTGAGDGPGGVEPSPAPSTDVPPSDREHAPTSAGAIAEDTAVSPPDRPRPARRAPSGWSRNQIAKLAVLVCGAAAAYHFTLLTFADNLRLDTPLAYLPLMPLFALGTALTTVRRHRGGRPCIQDRQLDLLVGIPILVIALLLITVVPAKLSTFYWSERPDVLSFALFVTGTVILLYGVPWFWRLRGSLAFLVLMWPALYLHAGASLLSSLADATSGALSAVVAHLPLGIAAGVDPSSFTVHPSGQPSLLVIVGSACAGGNAVLGVALLGAALLFNRSGSPWRKAAWLATGVVLAFAGNLVRLLSIMALASAGHPALALGGFHEVVGLAVFAAVTAVMLAATPVFGLARRLPVSAPPEQQIEPARQGPRRLLRTVAGLTVAGIVVGLMAVADHALQPYAAFVDGSGLPTMAGFAAGTQTLPARSSQRIAAYDYQQYYGAESSADRYLFRRDGSSPVFADVVRTPDQGALDTYNLQNCFLFHNLDIRSRASIDLGNGVSGLLLDYQEPQTQRRWSTVSWAWPVRQGDRTIYERVVLTTDLAGSTPAMPAAADHSTGLRDTILSLLNWFDAAPVSGAYSAANAALERFGREAVAATVAAPSSSVALSASRH
jgi:exosortase/archaeosortase family protein